jgi:cell wall-associated NlpC family hydrolase
MAQTRNLITQGARQRGLDPRALLAIASVEGGFGGAIGDQGTSYGPFQLHQGGALPHGRGNNWANSPQGINYALDKIASVARGKTGRAAIEAIVRQFERPANPGGEIQKALARYGQVGGGDAGTRAPRPVPLNGLAAAPNTPAVGAALLQAIQAGPQHNDFSQVYSLLHQKAQTDAKQLSKNVVVDHNEPLAPDAVPIVKAAKQYLGTKYQWGGTTPKGFDCSGFVQYLYGHAGINLPRTTYQQIKAGVAVNPSNLKAGDILFFGSKADPHHEGLYIGNGQFIHAPHTGDHVRISSLKDYGLHLVAARRVQ